MTDEELNRKYVMAMGLLTVLAPSMEIDVCDPIGMAQEIFSNVEEEQKNLRDTIDRQDARIREVEEELRITRMKNDRAEEGFACRTSLLLNFVQELGRDSTWGAERYSVADKLNEILNTHPVDEEAR